MNKYKLYKYCGSDETIILLRDMNDDTDPYKSLYGTVIHTDTPLNHIADHTVGWNMGVFIEITDPEGVTINVDKYDTGAIYRRNEHGDILIEGNHEGRRNRVVIGKDRHNVYGDIYEDIESNVDTLSNHLGMDFIDSWSEPLTEITFKPSKEKTFQELLDEVTMNINGFDVTFQPPHFEVDDIPYGYDVGEL